MPVLKHDAFFRQHPVFTGDELARHLARVGSSGVKTQEKVLGYRGKTGRLRWIRQGAAVQGSVQEVLHHLIQVLADARDLAARNAVSTQRLDQNLPRTRYWVVPTRVGCGNRFGG